MKTAWNLNIKRAWCLSWTGSTGAGALTVERKLGDRLGLSLKGTVLAEGVVLIGEPVIKADDDDDPTNTLYSGFDWIPPVEWLDNKAGKKVPTVVMSGENDGPHELEIQSCGPICDDPVAWVLALRALFAEMIFEPVADGKSRQDEMKIPSVEEAREIRQAYLVYAANRIDAQRDYLLLQGFIAENAKALDK